MTPMLETGIKLCELGYSPLWLRHKSKAPLQDGWSQLPIPNVEILKTDYQEGYNLGVRLGSWSQPQEGHGLVALDIDIKGGEDFKCDPYETLYRYCDIEPGIEVQSGSGLGRHIWFICPIAKLPQKANRTLAKSQETITLPDGSTKQAWMIEVLSTGKQLVCPPSIHPDSGQAYKWLDSLDKMPPVIPQSILDAIYEEPLKPVKTNPPAKLPMSRKKEESIADAFRAVPWSTILEPHGWREAGQRGEYLHWTRPGKRDGTSASTMGDVFYPFTSSTEFEAEKGYSKFTVYSILQHGGNMSRAAKHIASMKGI